MIRRVFKSGDPFIWLTGGALAVSLLMITGLLALILTRALGTFWPATIVEARLADGGTVLGPIRERTLLPEQPDAYRLQFQVGNRDLYGADFRWVSESDITAQTEPREAVCVERREWGNFYGYLEQVWSGDTAVGGGDAATWDTLVERLPAARALIGRIQELETSSIAAASVELEKRARARKKQESRGADAAALAAFDAETAPLLTRYEAMHHELETLVAASRRDRVTLRTGDGKQKDLLLIDIVRLYRSNDTGTAGKVGIYLSKVWEFVSGTPRESNTEGGIFPALFGTVMMVLLMSIAVMPFGVLAALYLREYARQGLMVQVVRIAVNNLAGVPSIVFGVFGLGFFVYFIGGGLDSWFFADRLPSPTFGTGGILWASLTLALLTVPVVIVATEEALAAVPKEYREGSLALGATKFETIWKVVLPNAMPGLLTGLILAMARGAGEVAPLMITGVVKLAPTLPFDLNFPFLHLDRKFMHLGFHIYDVGFQSPNVEAAKPMVYATTLLLVGIVIALNLSAILIRNRLRRQSSGGAF